MSRTTSTPPAPAARFATAPAAVRRSPLQVVLSAAGLLVLLAGVPAVLLALGGGPPLPSRWPDRAWLTQAVGAEQVVAVLLAVVWLAWLQFVVCTVVEIAAALRGGVLARPVPLAGPVQRLARGLVAGLLLSATVAVPGVGSAAPPAAPVAVVALDDTAGADLRAVPAVAVLADAPVQAHGGVPVVPASVIGEAVDSADLADLVGRKVYVVHPPEGRHHDSLWDIAERHLGDGRRYPEIFALNKGRQQPDGRTLELARLIQPGWYLVMPEDAVGVDRLTAEAAGAATEVVDAATADAATDAGSDAGSDADGGAGGAVTGGAGAASGGATTDAATGATTGPAGARLAAELGGAGLLGAGLVAALLVARRRGRPVAPSDDAVETEVWLRVGADPGRARFVDTALRSLAALCRDDGRPFPGVYAVLADDDEITLLVSPPSTAAPTPWTADGTGGRWVLPRVHLPRGGGHADAPLPSLVGLGRDDAGRDVLVDLAAAAGPVCVGGDADVAEQVVRALAVELATNPWSRDVRVTAVDLPAALADVGAGLVLPADPADPLAALRARVAPAAPDDVLTGRRPGAGPVEHVAFGRPPARDVTDDLRRLGAGGRLGIVVAGEVPGARWRLVAGADGTLAVDDLGLRVTANRLGDAALAGLAALFAAAAGRDPADPLDPFDPHDPDGGPGGPGSGGRWADATGTGWYAGVPAPHAAVDDGAWSGAQARIGLLGPVLVRAPGALDPSRVDLAAEVVAFLALHPNGVHPTVLGGALWPRGVTADVRDATVARVRDWLGDGPDGPRVRTDADGRLHLAADVAVDWTVFCSLLHEAARSAGSTAERGLLVRAVGLVRGPFAGGAAAGAYAWLPRTGLERVVPQVVTAAAHRLATLCLPDDPAAAGEAARCGLRADPCAQEAWRDLLRAEHAQWGADGVRQTAGQLREVLADLGTAPDPLTLALVDELAPGAAAAGTA